MKSNQVLLIFLIATLGAATIYTLKTQTLLKQDDLDCFSFTNGDTKQEFKFVNKCGYNVQFTYDVFLWQYDYSTATYQTPCLLPNQTSLMRNVTNIFDASNIKQNKYCQI